MPENDGNDGQPLLRLSISPEPTADERDAIVAAVVVLLTPSGATAAVMPPRPLPSRWGRAGRIEATRGAGGGTERGWGHRRSPWETPLRA